MNNKFVEFGAKVNNIQIDGISFISCRMPNDVLKQLDKVSARTGRTRNELILKCVEFALDKLQIIDEP